MTLRVPLHRALAEQAERDIVTTPGIRATLFRYPTGIEALRLANDRGEVVVLPWMGGMIWSARFDGVDLAMRSRFPDPVPATTIAETYGCFAFHSGLLRNGVPGPEDDHPAHGEFPCAPMQAAWLEVEADGAVRLVCERRYAMGFGAHYRAHASVSLAPDATLFDIGLDVENLSGKPMELMYMCHINFAFPEGGRIHQPAPFTPDRTAVRRAVPAHVQPNPDYLARIEELGQNPAGAERLDDPAMFDPEQVFYLHRLGRDAAGDTHLMLRRPEGDGFVASYSPANFPHTVRWLYSDPDAAVAAFALPSTCEPEGHAAETRKGNVRHLAPGARAAFRVTTGYLDKDAAQRTETLIASLA